MLFALLAACAGVTPTPPAEAPPPTEAPAEAPAEAPIEAPPAAEAPSSVVEGARAAAAGAAPGVDLTVVSTEPVDWPDACLGLPATGELCAMMITSGWRVVLEGGGQRWTFRTNGDGTQVRLESPR